MSFPCFHVAPNLISCLFVAIAADENAHSDKQEEIEGDEEGVPQEEAKEYVVKPPQKRRSSPFRRVKDTTVTDLLSSSDPRFLDNSYHAFRDGLGEGDWADKAASDFRTVKGKNFRHEKTKKKRGSYRGGKISTGVNSIKFE